MNAMNPSAGLSTPVDCAERITTACGNVVYYHQETAVAGKDTLSTSGTLALTGHLHGW